MNLDGDRDLSNFCTTRIAFIWTGDKEEADDVRERLAGAFDDRNPQAFREAVDRLAWLQFNKLFSVGVVGVLSAGILGGVFEFPMYGVGTSISLSGCIFMALLSGIRLFALKRLGRFQLMAYRSVIYVSVAPLIVSSVVLAARWL